MGLSSQLAASSLARPGVIANAAARPASPYAGQAVYQLDTNSLFIWNGSAWTPPMNLPWGKIAEAGGTNATSFSAGVALEVLSVAGTVTAGRSYRVTGKLAVQTSSSATPNSLYYTAGGLTKSLWYQTTAIGTNLNLGPSGFDIVSATELGVSSGTSSITFKLMWKCGAGGALNTNPDSYIASGAFAQRIIVEDIGPT